MKRVLVTGGSGFVGHPTVRSLLTRGSYEVHAVARHPPAEVDPSCHWHAADLLDPAQTALLVERVRPDGLLHLAWCGEHGRYWTSEENFDWVGASLVLLRAFRAAGGRRAVCVGTCAEYAPGNGPANEFTTALSHATPYAACKGALRDLLDAFAKSSGISTAWARLFFLYGPGEKLGRLVPSVARSLLRGDLPPPTCGSQVRDFLHVTDAADALVRLLESHVEGVVNVGSGIPVRIADVVAEIAAATGRPDLVCLNVRQTPPGEPQAVVACVRRLADEVGWNPRYDLRLGIRETVAWWAEMARGSVDDR